MNKLLLILLLTASATVAAYNTCIWTKVSQYTGMNGQKVCTWRCGFGSNAKHTTTSGYGYCPIPRQEAT